MPDTEASIFEEPGAKKRHAGIRAGAVRATGRPTAMPDPQHPAVANSGRCPYNADVFARILKRLRDLVRRGQYVMTTHADEEADADDFTVFDVESAILTGTIIERQKEAETGEWKYVISGEAVDGRKLSVVAKFGASSRIVYILTVYAE